MWSFAERGGLLLFLLINLVVNKPPGWGTVRGAGAALGRVGEWGQVRCCSCFWIITQIFRVICVK